MLMLDSKPVLGSRTATAVAPLPVNGSGAEDLTKGLKLRAKPLSELPPAVAPWGTKETV